MSPRLLHPQHLDGIWTGQTQCRLPYTPLSEYPEPWSWIVDGRQSRAIAVLPQPAPGQILLKCGYYAGTLFPKMLVKCGFKVYKCGYMNAKTRVLCGYAKYTLALYVDIDNRPSTD